MNYLKKNILSFIIGCILGTPFTLYAVNHQTPSNMRVYYDSGLFQEFSEHIELLGNETQQDDGFQNYEMTQEELAEEMYYDSLELLALCVEAEAADQGLIGKKYVCDVVLNRVDDEDYPDNITDVILQKNQFSVVLDGRIWEVEPTEETYQAIREELEVRTNYKVLFFCCEGYSKYGTDWKKIGDHYFSTK